MLNYGYAIVRAALARSLVAAGLLPAFGLHHHSIANAFNLVDDFIEPFRPFVDQNVVQHMASQKQESGSSEGEHMSQMPNSLSIQERRKLTEILFISAFCNAQSFTLLDAMEYCIASFVRAMRAKNPDFLILPAFLKA